MSKNILNSLILCFMVLLSFVALYTLNPHTTKPNLIIDPQNEVVNLDPRLLKVISLGQQRMISSLIWGNTILRSDLAHYDPADLNSWMYLRIKTVTTLAPYFYEAYSIGAQYLSIVKDDDQGAKAIYDQALLKFPTDHNLLYNSGFHYFYELGLREKATQLFEKSIRNGNKIHFLPGLVARMKAEGGHLKAAKLLLEENLKSAPTNGPIKERLKDSLYAVQAEIDLDCLNGKKMNCNYVDTEGYPYIKKGSEYAARKSWKKYRLRGKKFFKNKASSHRPKSN